MTSANQEHRPYRVTGSPHTTVEVIPPARLVSPPSRVRSSPYGQRTKDDEQRRQSVHTALTHDQPVREPVVSHTCSRYSLRYAACTRKTVIAA